MLTSRRNVPWRYWNERTIDGSWGHARRTIRAIDEIIHSNLVWRWHVDIHSTVRSCDGNARNRSTWNNDSSSDRSEREHNSTLDIESVLGRAKTRTKMFRNRLSVEVDVRRRRSSVRALNRLEEDWSLPSRFLRIRSNQFWVPIRTGRNTRPSSRRQNCSLQSNEDEYRSLFMRVDAFLVASSREEQEEHPFDWSTALSLSCYHQVSSRDEVMLEHIDKWRKTGITDQQQQFFLCSSNEDEQARSERGICSTFHS